MVGIKEVNEQLKIYHVSREGPIDYDTYSDFVLVCSDEKEARETNPDGGKWINGSWHFYSPVQGKFIKHGYYSGGWCDPCLVKVELMGMAKEGQKAGVICASVRAEGGENLRKKTSCRLGTNPQIIDGLSKGVHFVDCPQCKGKHKIEILGSNQPGGVIRLYEGLRP